MMAEDKMTSKEQTKMFDKAWTHPDMQSLRKWWEAVKTLLFIWPNNNYGRRHIRVMPPNCRFIECKQVFEIKCIGLHCIRLVLCCYSQVPRINCPENYSLVMNSITFWVLLLIMIHFGLLAKAVNVKTAFLYGELEEEIHIEHSPSMKDIGKDD